MAVTLSEDDFQYVYDTLRRANTPYDHEEALVIVAMERRSWEILQRVAEEHGLVPGEVTDIPAPPA
jgi:hypothetical protein